MDSSGPGGVLRLPEKVGAHACKWSEAGSGCGAVGPGRIQGATALVARGFQSMLLGVKKSFEEWMILKVTKNPNLIFYLCLYCVIVTCNEAALDVASV